MAETGIFSPVADTLTERKERWARKQADKEKSAVRSRDRLPPGQHLTNGFPVLDLGIQPVVHSTTAGPWADERFARS